MTNKHRIAPGLMLTRAITPEQINAGQDGQRGGLYRQAEVAQILDADSRTVELAFSSEYEVERWFGTEILDHSPGAMRTARLESGAALLVNHDWDDQIGVVESVRIDADRRGRAVVRFGKGARATEIWQDVQDGIRRHVSVGYSVHGVNVEERKDQPDRVTVIDWEPYEISLVSVPADPSVGVGRSMETSPEDNHGHPRHTDPNCDIPKETAIMNDKILRDAKGNLVRAKVDESGAIIEVLEMIEKAGDAQRQAGRQALDAERQRVRALNQLGDQYNQMELARTMIDEGKAPEDMRAALLDKMSERGKALGESGAANVGLSDKEVRQYSFLRVARALAEPTNKRLQEAAAFEFEASRAAAERAGKDPQGIMIPADVLTRALNSATSGTAAGDTGGYSVATDLMASSFIELLRNRSVAMQLGRTLGGLVGNIDIPRQAAGATGYWIGEDDDASETGIELEQIGLSAKTCAAFSEITRRLLMQSSLDVEAMVRADLAAALALTIDKAVFYGTGTGNQPLGIANVTGINAVDFAGAASGGSGVLPTYAEVVKMESEIAADNADVNSMAYVLNTGMRGHFKTTQKFAGTDGSVIWEPGNTLNGYRAEVTNQINAGDLFLGNFADLLIGMWGGLELNVDPYTHSTKGRLRIVAFQDVDVQLRRVESFCLGRDAS